MNYKEIAVKIGVDLTEFDRGIQTVNSRIDTLNRDVERSYGALSGELRNAGIAASVAITAPLALAARSAFDATLRYDAMTKQMETMTGSAASAEVQMKRLYELSKAPGIGYEEAVAGASRLYALGVSADNTTNILQGLATGIARAGKGRVEFAAAFEQMSQSVGKAKLEMVDWKIVASYIPEFYKVVNQLYGTTDLDTIRKQGVSAKQFTVEVMSALGKLNAPMDTLKNSAENMGQAVDMAFASLGKATEDVLKPTIDSVTRLAEEFSELPESTRKYAIAAASVAAATGPMLIGLSLAPGLFGRVSAGARMAGGGMETLALKAMYAWDAFCLFSRRDILAVASGGWTRFMGMLSSGWDSVRLRAMYAWDGIRAFSGGIRRTIPNVKALIAANGGLASSTRAVWSSMMAGLGPGGALTLAVAGFALLAYRIRQVQTAAEAARGKMKAMNEASVPRQLKDDRERARSRTDKQLRNEMYNINMQMEKDHTRIWWLKTVLKINPFDEFTKGEIALLKEDLKRLEARRRVITAEEARRRDLRMQAAKEERSERVRQEQAIDSEILALKHSLAGRHIEAAKAQARAEYLARKEELKKKITEKGHEFPKEAERIKLEYDKELYDIEQRRLQQLEEIDAVKRRTEQQAVVGNLSVASALAAFNGNNLKAAITDAVGKYTQAFYSLEEQKRLLPDNRKAELDPFYAAADKQYKLDIEKARRDEANRQAALKSEAIRATSAADAAELRLAGKDFEARKLEILDARDAELSDIARRRSNKEALPEGIEDSIRRKADADIAAAREEEAARQRQIAQQEATAGQEVNVGRLRFAYESYEADRLEAQNAYQAKLFELNELERQGIEVTQRKAAAQEELNLALEQAARTESRRQNANWREEYGMWLEGETMDLRQMAQMMATGAGEMGGSMRRNGLMLAANLTEIQGQFLLKMNELMNSDLKPEQIERRIQYQERLRDLRARGAYTDADKEYRDAMKASVGTKSSLDDYISEIVKTGFQAQFSTFGMQREPATAQDMERIIAQLQEEQRGTNSRLEVAIDQLEKISGDRPVGSY